MANKKNGWLYDKDVSGYVPKNLTQMTVWLAEDIEGIKKDISDFKGAKEQWEKRVVEIKKLLSDSKAEQSYIDDLEKEFPDSVIAILKLLTHDKQTDYMEYIKNIKNNEIAKKVKIADIRHNSDETRLDELTEKYLKRNGKYKKVRFWF